MSTIALKGHEPLVHAPLANSLDAKGLAAATFTRASTGTYIDPADRRLKTAAINTPRFEKNGLLLEPQSTNLFCYSEALEYWNHYGSSNYSNALDGPDGNVAMDSIIEDGSTGQHNVYYTINVSAGVYYSFSVFVRPSARNWCFLIDNVIGAYSFFNLSGDGTIGTNNGFSNPKIEKVANSCYRISVTYVPSSNHVAYFALGASTGDGITDFAGWDGHVGVLAWGVQLEQQWVATSYIPTGAATVTRSADSVYWPLSDSLKSVLSIDKAWHTSHQNQVGASFGTIYCDFTDATARAKFTSLDISPYASSGKMIILRDSTGKLAWGYLGAVYSVTGCMVYKDPALTIRGWVTASGFNTSDTAYTFDIVNACKAEGTVEVMFTPGCAPEAGTYPGIVSCNGPSGFTSLMYSNATCPAAAYDGTNCSAIGETPVGGQQILMATRFSSLTRQLQISTKRAGVLSHGGLTGFDGAFDLGTLQLACVNYCPSYFKNLSVYRRWLPDTEL
ncbi:MAG: hypothetical protein LLG06_02170 [Desulfobacteraceae bacterium]|nr:hypothetical protein [Desulfobacteraceae bacterium]